MIKFLNATYLYEGGGGVSGVSLEIQSGDFLMLIGRTGAGKTTLFRLLSLELMPQSGDVFLEELRAGSLRPSQLPIWRRRLGIVFQDLRLLDDRSCLENVRLAAVCDRFLPGGPKSRALKALASVGLSHKHHKLPNQLSTGEQQRVAVARALVNEPFVLIADEPVSNLDSDTSAEIVDLLMRINLAGTAILLATHQPERFEACNPRQVRIERGRIIAE